MPTPLPRLAAQTPATAQTAQMIRNGVYQLSNGSSSMTFRVSTITSARTPDLIGKRVISRLNSTGDWQMFAFLTETGELKLWQRFRVDEGALYIERCRELLHVLRTTADDSYTTGGNQRGRIRMLDASIEYTSLCQVCNQSIAGRDNRCGRHTLFATARSAPPVFETMAEVVYDSNTDSIEVPAAITQRLHRSEITPSLIR